MYIQDLGIQMSNKELLGLIFSELSYSIASLANRIAKDATLEDLEFYPSWQDDAERLLSGLPLHVQNYIEPDLYDYIEQEVIEELYKASQRVIKAN